MWRKSDHKVTRHNNLTQGIYWEKYRSVAASAWERSSKELSGGGVYIGFLGGGAFQDGLGLAGLCSLILGFLLCRTKFCHLHVNRLDPDDCECSLGRTWKLEILRGGVWPRKCSLRGLQE